MGSYISPSTHSYAILQVPARGQSPNSRLMPSTTYFASERVLHCVAAKRALARDRSRNADGSTSLACRKGGRH
jgi:hypothetical protein